MENGYDFVYFQACILRLFFGPILHPECRLLNLNLASREIS